MVFVARALADPIGFLGDLTPPLILDEIQHASELLSYVKTAIDEDRRPGRYFLTGSQSLALMHGVSQSLAGRVAVLTLLPFGLEELWGGRVQSIDALLARLFAAPGTHVSKRQGGRPNLGDWLLRGAYPEPRAHPRVDRELWCSSYIQTYLERDVRALLNVGDLNAFDRFLRLCAARTTQILNLADLARDTGVSMPTARRWLSVLEASHEVFLLPPYFANYGKRLIKAPKLYFLDTALAAYLMGIRTLDGVLQGPAAGPLFETAVVTAFRKAFCHRGLSPSMYYWRSSDGLEIDLLVERDQRLYPVEIKSTATVTPGHAASLRKWLDLSGAGDAGRGIIAAKVDAPLAVAPGIRAVPWDSI